jgi:copper chaperone CopZ
MTTMQISIEGMHCGHCVAAVKQALETVPGVASAEVQIGRATIEAESDISTEDVRSAVEDAGYFAQITT